MTDDITGPPPLLGLIAALVVCVAGVAAALTHDYTKASRTAPGTVSSTRPVGASSGSTASTSSSTAGSTASTSSSTAGSTLGTLPPSAFSTAGPSTTVRPAVPSPEAAANGLWAAYSSSNRGAADRFASAAVVDALFAQPFSGEEGNFQGCRIRQPDVFDCSYVQTSTHYTMTAQSDAGGNFKIVVIEISSSADTTSSSAAG